MKFLAAAVHAAPVFMDLDASIAKAVSLILEAGRQGVEFLVFPECFVPGYPYFIDCYAPRTIDAVISRYHSASVEVGGPELHRIQVAARTARTVVVVGVSERMRHGRTCFNSQVFIDKDGSILGVHRKLQPTYAERTVWGQGGGGTLAVFDSSVGRVGGLVCWEHTMNLARQSLIVQRQQIHAAAWPGLSTLPGLEPVADDQIEAMMRTHALSAQVFVVAASNPVDHGCLEWMEKSIGPQSDVKAGGGYSAVIHPFNQYLAGPHRGPEERLIIAPIDYSDVDRIKVWVDGCGHYSRPEIVSLRMSNEPLWLDEQPGFDRDGAAKGPLLAFDARSTA